MKNREPLSPERRVMIEECLKDKGRYKNCSFITRMRVLKARVIWFLLTKLNLV